ncbi:MAG TPA: hypothetical protein VF407_19530, partial [Polyangiaceae bacterium]
MMPPILWRHSFEGTVIVLALAGLFTRFTMPGFAKLRAVKWGYALVAVVLVASHLFWLLGPTYPFKYWGCSVACYSLLLMLFVAPSLPFAALVRAGMKRMLKVKEAPVAPAPAAPSTERELTRRQVLNAATAAVPLVAIGAGGRGFVNGVALPDIPRILISSPTLPAALEGLAILQLSDL